MADNIFSVEQVIGAGQKFFTPTSESDFYPYFPKVTGLTKKVLNKLYSLTYYQGSLKNLKSMLKSKQPSELAKDLVKNAHEKLRNEYSNYLLGPTGNILDEVNNKQLNAELEATLILNLNDSLKAIDEWQLTMLLENLNSLDDASFNTLIGILSNGKGDVKIAIRRSFLLDFLTSARAKIQQLNKEFQEVQKQASEFMKALNKALTPGQELLLLQLLNSKNIEAFHQAFVKYKQQLESRISWCRSCGEKLLQVTTQADKDMLRKIVEGSKAGLCAADSALNLKIRRPLERIIDIISSDYIFALLFAAYAAGQGVTLAVFTNVASFLQFATSAELFFTNFERWLDMYSNIPFVRILKDIYDTADATSLSLNLSWDIGLNISNAVSAYITQLSKLFTDPYSLSTKELVNLICETATVLWSVGTTVTYRAPSTIGSQQRTSQQAQPQVNQAAGTTTTPTQQTLTRPVQETAGQKTNNVMESSAAESEELRKKIEQDKLEISENTGLDYSYFEPKPTISSEVLETPQPTGSTTGSEAKEEPIPKPPAGIFEWQNGDAPHVVYIPLRQEPDKYRTFEYKFRYVANGEPILNPTSFVVSNSEIARVEESGDNQWLKLVISNEKLYSTKSVSISLRYANDNNSVEITIQPYPAQIVFTSEIKYTPLAATATLLIDASYVTIDQNNQAQSNKLPGLELKVTIPELGISDLSVRAGEPTQISSAGLAGRTEASIKIDYGVLRTLFGLDADTLTIATGTVTITRVGPNKVNKIHISRALSVPVGQISSTDTSYELLGVAPSASRQFIAYAVRRPIAQTWQTQIGIVAIAISGPQLLETRISTGTSTSFVWHPNKDFLFFTKSVFGTNGIQILVWSAAKAAETGPTVLVDYSALSLGEAGVRNLSISADGSKLAWSTPDALYIATLYTNGQSIQLDKLHRYPVGKPDERLLAQAVMQLSPDGSKIAYAYDNKLLLFELSSEQTTTIATDVNVKYIAWSPDGKYIAFVNSLGENEQNQIKIFDVAGQTLLNIALQSSAKGQAWLTWLGNTELVYEPSTPVNTGDLACCELSGSSQPSVRTITVIRDQVASEVQSAEVWAKHARFYISQTNDNYVLSTVMVLASNVIGIGQATE
jgi:WD40 repeat protein